MKLCSAGAFARDEVRTLVTKCTREIPKRIRGILLMGKFRFRYSWRTCVFSTMIALAVTRLVHFVVVNTRRPGEGTSYLGVIHEAKFRPIVLPLGVGTGVVHASIDNNFLVGVSASRTVVSVGSGLGLNGSIWAYNVGGVFPQRELFMFPITPKLIYFFQSINDARPCINVSLVCRGGFTNVRHQHDDPSFRVRSTDTLERQPRAILGQKYFPSQPICRKSCFGLFFSLCRQFVGISRLFLQFGQLLLVKEDQPISLLPRIPHFGELALHRSELFSLVMNVENGSYGNRNSGGELPERTVPQNVLPCISNSGLQSTKGYCYIALGAIFFVFGALSIKAGGDVMVEKWGFGIAGIVFGVIMLIVFYRLVIHGITLIDPI